MAIITGTDLTAALNPTGNANRFNASTSITSAALANVIAGAEGRVKGSLPESYRRLLTCANGLVLTRDAAQGEVAFTIPAVLRNVDTVNSRVWANPTFKWGDRSRWESATATWTTTACTLDTALVQGDVVVAEVFHTGATIPAMIKQFVIDVAVSMTLTANPTMQVDPSLRQMYADSLLNTRADLELLSKGRLRVDEWDALQLIDENETAVGSGWSQMYPAW